MSTYMAQLALFLPGKCYKKLLNIKMSSRDDGTGFMRTKYDHDYGEGLQQLVAMWVELFEVRTTVLLCTHVHIITRSNLE